MPGQGSGGSGDDRSPKRPGHAHKGMGAEGTNTGTKQCGLTSDLWSTFSVEHHNPNGGGGGGHRHEHAPSPLGQGAGFWRSFPLLYPADDKTLQIFSFKAIAKR